MMHRNKRMKRPVSASELAQMGMCERRVVYEHRLGERSTASQCAARQRGLTEHERFYLEAVRASYKKGRCYVATLIWGEGPETAALRLLRDRVLRKGALGRWIIGGYYRSAPFICTVLVRHAWLQPLVGIAIRTVAWVVGCALRYKRRERDR
ncbi:CFI-box-CTERM domain-containing protein [Noviherbaspirillum sedimenti]|nr:CFI-box-CTERM domain-containing protein [Noviherbaspirillum sedimenti]